MQNLLQFIRNRFHPLWHLRRMKAFRYVQQRFDFTVFIKINGVMHPVAVRFLRDISWMLNRSFEPEIQRVFRMVMTHLQPRTFYDIGANIGLYSWIVRQHSSTKRVVMFEPDPTNYKLLTQTISGQRLTGCDVINAAVSDEPGRMEFIIDQASGATGSLEAASDSETAKFHQANYGMENNRILVDVVTLDDIINEHPAPDFIKIDVEGAEHFVLAGATQCLDVHKPTLIIETQNQELLSQLSQQGYTLFAIDSGNVLLVDKTKTKAIREFSAVLQPVAMAVFEE